MSIQDFYCNALSSYLYYENATCSGDTHIEGDVVYEYDDSSSMNTNGFVVEEYNGPCNYLDGGSYNFWNGRAENDIYMTKGYCITCDGVIGCSPVYDTCDEFYTIAPTNDTDYEENAGENNGYVIVTAKTVQDIIYVQLMEPQSTIPITALVVGAISMVGLLALLSGSIAAVKKLQESTMEFCNDNLNFSDGEYDDNSSVNTDDEEGSNNLIPSFMT
jgi:hypothetical protein